MTLLSELYDYTDFLNELNNSPVSIIDTTTIEISGLGKLYNISGTTADYIITLPEASLSEGNFIAFSVLTTATKLYTIKGNSTELIGDFNTIDIWKKEFLILYSNGISWDIISYKKNPMIFYISADNSQFYSTNVLSVVRYLTVNINNTGFSNINLTNNTITAPRRSDYLLNTFGRIGQIGPNGLLELRLQINNADLINRCEQKYRNGGFEENQSIMISTTKTLQKGDIVRNLARQDRNFSRPLWGPVLYIRELL